VLESHRGTGEVQAVSAYDPLRISAKRSPGFSKMQLQCVGPAPERFGIVRTQTLGVQRFEVPRRHGVQHDADMHELASGKNVFLNEIAHSAVKLEAAVPPAVMQWFITRPSGLSTRCIFRK